MKTCWFVVIESLDSWWVDCEGKSYGPFGSRDDAALEGVRLARTYGDPKRRAELFVPDDSGKMHRSWVGPDPAN